MRSILWLLAFFFFSCIGSAFEHPPCTPLPQEAEPKSIPGIGFDLSLSHGTAALFFTNGTRIQVAQVEGSPSYQVMMLEYLKHPDRLTVQNLSSRPFISTASSHFLMPLLGTRLGNTLERYTGCFLPKSMHRNTELFEMMIGALQASTEAYLGHTIKTVDITLPFEIASGRADVLDCAITNNALNTSLSYQKASVAACYANKAYREPTGDDIPDPQLILALDYSRGALTAELLMEEDLIFDRLRYFANASLGAETFNAIRQDSVALTYWSNVKHLIQKVAEMPPPKTYFTTPDLIARLILFGDRSHDPSFLIALREALEDRGGMQLLRTAEEDMADPVFASAVGTAMASRWKRTFNEVECHSMLLQ